MWWNNKRKSDFIKRKKLNGEKNFIIRKGRGYYEWELQGIIKWVWKIGKFNVKKVNRSRKIKWFIEKKTERIWIKKIGKEIKTRRFHKKT